MPIGSYANLYYIAKELEDLKPKTVLDLGIGLGMNAVLIRQYLDAAHELSTHITGVEIFAPYRNPMWGLYDTVVEDDILVYLPTTDRTFDCILMTDVIEHFYKSIAVQLLRLLPKYLNPGGCIIVSTPGVFVPQAAVNGNMLETHLCFMPPESFPDEYVAIKQGVDHHGHETTIMKYVKK